MCYQAGVYRACSLEGFTPLENAIPTSRRDGIEDNQPLVVQCHHQHNVRAKSHTTSLRDESLTGFTPHQNAKAFVAGFRPLGGTRNRRNHRL